MKTYIGDSIYLEFNEQYFKITTNNGMDNTNTILIEPELMEDIILFVQKVQKDK